MRHPILLRMRHNRHLNPAIGDATHSPPSEKQTQSRICPLMPPGFELIFDTYAIPITSQTFTPECAATNHTFERYSPWHITSIADMIMSLIVTFWEADSVTTPYSPGAHEART